MSWSLQWSDRDSGRRDGQPSVHDGIAVVLGAVEFDEAVQTHDPVIADRDLPGTDEGDRTFDGHPILELIRAHHSDSLDEVRLIAERRPRIAAMSAQERRPHSPRTVVSLC